MISSKSPEAKALLDAVDGLGALIKTGGATTPEATVLVAYACLKLNINPDQLATQVMVMGIGVLLRQAAEPQANVPGGKA
jgi:hypothetical protein